MTRPADSRTSGARREAMLFRSGTMRQRFVGNFAQQRVGDVIGTVGPGDEQTGTDEPAKAVSDTGGPERFDLFGGARAPDHGDVLDRCLVERFERVETRREDRLQCRRQRSGLAACLGQRHQLTEI